MEQRFENFKQLLKHLRTRINTRNRVIYIHKSLWHTRSNVIWAIVDFYTGPIKIARTHIRNCHTNTTDNVDTVLFCLATSLPYISQSNYVIKTFWTTAPPICFAMVNGFASTPVRSFVCRHAYKRMHAILVHTNMVILQQTHHKHMRT